MDKKMISREHFFRATGYLPEEDDIERCNCKKAGSPMHIGCGWNHVDDMPNFYPKDYWLIALRMALGWEMDKS